MRKSAKVNLTTFGEAAVELETTIAVISGLVLALGLNPKPVPRNGNAKGLNDKDMNKLRRALGKNRRSALTKSSQDSEPS